MLQMFLEVSRIEPKSFQEHLEAGQVKLQSRLEEEEQAKAALMGRIQRLTKLILVSTKNTIPPNLGRKSHRRRHSFGEDELAYLPERKREVLDGDGSGRLDSESSPEVRTDLSNLDDLVDDYRRNRRRGMLGWFKLKKPEQMAGSSPSVDNESSASASPSSSSKLSKDRFIPSDIKDRRRKLSSIRGNGIATTDSLHEQTQASDLFTASRRLPPTGTTITDQIELLREQVKMLAGEVAFGASSLKRLSEQARSNPGDSELQEQMQKLKDEIREKKHQIRLLEQRMVGTVETTPHTSNGIEMSQAMSRLATQLNEKEFELEIKKADNRVLQEQLQVKVSENAEMQQTILLLRQQLDSLSGDRSRCCGPKQKNEYGVMTLDPFSLAPLDTKTEAEDGRHVFEETCLDETTPTSVISLNRVLSQEDSKESSSDAFLNSQLLMQAAEIEALRQEKVQICQEKDGLMIHSQKLAEEGSYAKELASAAAVELHNLAEEVTKLSYQNAKLTADLAAAKEACCPSNCCNAKKNGGAGARFDFTSRKPDGVYCDEFDQELSARYQREASLVAALSQRDDIESELRKRLDEAKRREEDLENELANMWGVVAKLRKSASSDTSTSDGFHASNGLKSQSRRGFSSSSFRSNQLISEDGLCGTMEEISKFDELRSLYDQETKRRKDLERFVSRLKGDDISGLDYSTLDELQNLHVEAITKICHAKAR